MTKVTVFGQEDSKKEEKKSIELVRQAQSSGHGFTKAKFNPEEFDNLCLLGKAMSGEDWIMAWDDNSSTKAIYLGHWNDGVVGG